MENVRSHIKKWEYDFQKVHGRQPSRDDIKKDAVIRLKYKQYSYYKQGKPEKAKEVLIPQLGPETPSKNRTVALNLMNTPSLTARTAMESSTSVPEDSPVRVSELGPTPQLNGKVLSIFDILRSPEKSPLKNGMSAGSAQTSPFKTPTATRRKLNLSITDKPIPKLGSFKTPSRPNTRALNSHIEETPAYFNEETPKALRRVSTDNDSSRDIHEDGESPATPSQSPIFHRVKPIRKLIGELYDIKDDLKYGDYDLDELLLNEKDGRSVLETLVEEGDEERLESGAEDQDQDQDEGDLVPSGRTFQRKVKRQTRRVKMKARPMEATDKFEEGESQLQASNPRSTRSKILNLRLQQVAADSLPKSLQAPTTLDVTSDGQATAAEDIPVDENENWSDFDEGAYVKNTVKYDGKKKNSYNNFKSMRINKPKRGGRFGRR